MFSLELTELLHSYHLNEEVIPKLNSHHDSGACSSVIISDDSYILEKSLYISIYCTLCGRIKGTKCALFSIK